MKKLFYYALGFVLMFWLVFAAFGIFKPQYSYESQVEVEAPIDFAWKIFMDDQYMPEWIGGFEKSELVLGEPDAVGSTYKMIIVNGQERMELLEKITAHIPQEKYAFDMDNDMFTGNTAVSFEAGGDAEKTIIRSNNLVRGKAWYQKSILYVLRRSMKQQSDLSYESLKRVIEREYKAEKEKPSTEAEGLK